MDFVYRTHQSILDSVSNDCIFNDLLFLMVASSASEMKVAFVSEGDRSERSSWILDKKPSIL
jgi:hypothetical protein